MGENALHFNIRSEVLQTNHFYHILDPILCNSELIIQLAKLTIDKCNAFQLLKEEIKEAPLNL